jgi:hypothetical protein
MLAVNAYLFIYNHWLILPLLILYLYIFMNSDIHYISLHTAQ